MLRIAMTPGEPAGVGPELLVRLAQKTLGDIELVAFASPSLLEQTAARLKVNLLLQAFNPKQPVQSGNGTLTIVPFELAESPHPGTLNAANADYVLQALRAATDGCLAGTCQALVTGPIHKGIINEAGIAFTGHTEFLAVRSGCDQVVMMLATKGLRVALATTHLPLKEVAGAINQAQLQRTLEILHGDLHQKFGVLNPIILVCGLNPHAGESGHMGREEIDVIEPVLNRLRDQGMDLRGPLPADTLFTPHHLDHADAVLAMYHDQGLPVLKYAGFGRAVNITLGLPFIRTSVDHGTALDIAGTGRANLGSLTTALTTAIEMAHAQRAAL